MSISHMDKEKWNSGTFLYHLSCTQQNWNQTLQFSSPSSCA